MSPYFQQPLVLGADMSVHSTTKFFERPTATASRSCHLRQTKSTQTSWPSLQKALGRFSLRSNAGCCYVVLRRWPSAWSSTIAMAGQWQIFFADHKKVKKVFYPGLPNHPQYQLSCQQMSGFGSMITFETGSLANAKKMLKESPGVFAGESLGGVETLISHPATMTPRSVGEKGRKAIGITDCMVRISVGIEDLDDILTDLIKR